MEGLTQSTFEGPPWQNALALNTAGLAYNRGIAWLQNATMTGMTRTQGVWIAALTRPASPLGGVVLCAGCVGCHGCGGFDHRDENSTCCRRNFDDHCC